MTLPPNAAPDRLMSQANPQQRHLARKMADQLDADSGFLRRARAGREHDPFRVHRLHLGGRHLVIAAHLDLRTQFAQILHQVVGERIVIVEDENHKLDRRVSSLYQSCPLRCQTSPALQTSTSINLQTAESYSPQDQLQKRRTEPALSSRPEAFSRHPHLPKASASRRILPKLDVPNSDGAGI